MLQNKSTTIVSEVKGFFTSTEKATNVIFEHFKFLDIIRKTNWTSKQKQQ